MMKNITENALANKNIPDSVNRAVKNQMKNGTWGHEINFKQEVAKIVAEPVKDAQGNYIAKATLTNDEKAQLKELRSMMDHEDIASLDNSLLLNEHIAKGYSPATIAAVNKKQKEKGGETDAAFVNAFRDVVLKHSNEHTVESVVKNTGNKESILYDEALKHKYTPEYTTRLKALKEAEKKGIMTMAPEDAQELSSLNLKTAVTQSMLSEQQRSARLKELFAKGTSITPTEQKELDELIKQRA
jgi:ABC-type nitrate/sulfonate/bicarbonate transport system substrate-binding protein